MGPTFSAKQLVRKSLSGTLGGVPYISNSLGDGLTPEAPRRSVKAAGPVPQNLEIGEKPQTPGPFGSGLGTARKRNTTFIYKKSHLLQGTPIKVMAPHRGTPPGQIYGSLVWEVPGEDEDDPKRIFGTMATSMALVSNEEALLSQSSSKVNATLL